MQGARARYKGVLPPFNSVQTRSIRDCVALSPITFEDLRSLTRGSRPPILRLHSSGKVGRDHQGQSYNSSSRYAISSRALVLRMLVGGLCQKTLFVMSPFAGPDLKLMNPDVTIAAKMITTNPLQSENSRRL